MAIRPLGMEDTTVGEPQEVGRARVGRPADVEAGVAAEDHPSGVQQEHVGAGDRRAQQAVDGRDLSARHPSQPSVFDSSQAARQLREQSNRGPRRSPPSYP
jgi:hypothetical protein